jgi:GntR family transcriptional repressor for pyruvate dehydrogenase complex
MFTPITRSRPVDRVASSLRASILAGTPAPGATLPAERELAASLGVSRLTLRAALSRLEAEGLVRARQGDGVHVLDPARHGTLQLLEHLSVEARPDLFRGFLELRRALAAEVVALACGRISEPALAELRSLVAQQRTESEPGTWLERDLAITRAILVGADNQAMVLLLNSVEGVWRAHPALAAALAADRALALAGYDLVLGLLAGRDGSHARTLVRAALEALDASALASFGRSR